MNRQKLIKTKFYEDHNMQKQFNDVKIKTETSELDRQFMPIYYNTNLDDDPSRNELKIDNKMKQYVNKKDYMLMSVDEYNNLEKVYKNRISSSEKSKYLDWSSYLMQPNLTGGRGFSDLDENVPGKATRLDNEINERNVDYNERHMLPLDSIMVNYAGIEYDRELRGGTSTRTFKRAYTQFNDRKNNF